MTVAGRAATALGLLLVLVGGLLLGAAGPASAHAVLLVSDPVADEVLPEAPEVIRLRFSEAVRAAPEGVAVLDAAGEEVAASASTSDTSLDIVLDQEVEVGTLVVVWRVISADGHPVGGSLTFSVGSPSAVVAPPPVVEEGAVEPPVLLTPLRALGYTGLLVTAGLVVFLVVVLPATHQADTSRRRILVLARSSAPVTALAWAATLPVVAAYQAGGGVGALTGGAAWAALPVTEYVVVGLVAVGAVLAVRTVAADRGGRGAPWGALVLVGAATAAPALVGHTRAASPEPVAVAADVAHLCAGSVWLGGLVGLCLCLPDLAGRDDLAARTLARFSTLAAGAVAVLLVAGGLLSWRIVGSWATLTGTGHGQLLLAKTTVVAVAVGIAAWNRWRLLPRVVEASRRRDRRAGVRPVVRAVAAEAALLVLALALTGALVDRSPEPAQAAASGLPPGLDPEDAGPHTASFEGGVDVIAAVSPHAAGPNDLTIQLLDSAGAPTEGVSPPTVRLTTEGVDLGEVELESVAPGTYTADVVLPTPGTWRLQLSLRTSEFANPVTTLDFVVV